ncbi:MAG TPA: methylamine utilization protein [Xanthomonadaceae bacterium]|jgi:plastocyanin
MRTRRLGQWIRVAVLAGALVCMAATQAAGLLIRISDDKGHPVGDAVVTVLPQDPAMKLAPRRASAPATKIIDQKNETFIPYIQTFRPGDSVLFRNSDTMRHHVYTFSPLKPFEFVLVPGDSSKPIELDQTGVIAVGCNIHDQMITYLYISDAPWIAQSGANGQVEFRDVPAGAWNVRVWHPRLRPGKPDLAQSTTIVAAEGTKTLNFSLSLLPDSRRDFDREHTRY